MSGPDPPFVLRERGKAATARFAILLRNELVAAGSGGMRRPLVTAPGPAEPHGPRRCGGPGISRVLQRVEGAFAIERP
jgi:hypothetical protein